MKTKVGRPLKNPELGPRVPICVKLPRKTVVTLRIVASRRRCSQSDVLIAAIAHEANLN